MSGGLIVDRVPAADGDLSFRAGPGSVVALHGPPGSGTSSLLPQIAGVEAPFRGTVLLAGAPTDDDRLTARCDQVVLAPRPPGPLSAPAMTRPIRRR